LMLQNHWRRCNIANSGDETACSTMCSMRSRRHNWRLNSTAMGIVAQASGREGVLKLGMMEMAMVVSSVGRLFFLSFLAFEF
jgi:hypothetical protein